MKEQPKKRSRVEQFYDKFRQVVTHHGKTRSEKRKAYKQQSKLSRSWPGSQFSRENAAHKRKTKIRNRRNRKLTRALHQRERR